MMLVEVIGYWWEVISTTVFHEFDEFLSRKNQCCPNKVLKNSQTVILFTYVQRNVVLRILSIQLWDIWIRRLLIYIRNVLYQYRRKVFSIFLNMGIFLRLKIVYYQFCQSRLWLCQYRTNIILNIINLMQVLFFDRIVYIYVQVPY